MGDLYRLSYGILFQVYENKMWMGHLVMILVSNFYHQAIYYSIVVVLLLSYI